MRQRDAGYAIERLAVRGRLFLIGAALLLCLPDFGAAAIGIAATLLLASNVLPAFVCRSYDRYSRYGAWCTVVRGVDVLMLALTGLLPQAHNTKLWMLSVPLVMVQALARRQVWELAGLTALACGGEVGVLYSAHTPATEWLRPILFLLASPIAGRVLRLPAQRIPTRRQGPSLAKPAVGYRLGVVEQGPAGADPHRVAVGGT